MPPHASGSRCPLQVLAPTHLLPVAVGFPLPSLTRVPDPNNIFSISWKKTFRIQRRNAPHPPALLRAEKGAWFRFLRCVRSMSSRSNVKIIATQRSIGAAHKYPGAFGTGSVFFYSFKKAIPNPEAKWHARGAEGSRREPTVLSETPAHIFEGKTSKFRSAHN